MTKPTSGRAEGEREPAGVRSASGGVGEPASAAHPRPIPPRDEYDPRAGRSDAGPGAGEASSAAPAPDADPDAPLGEDDALRRLAGGGDDDGQRDDASRASAVAELIAERLGSVSSGLRINSLALFNDSVSFGGGLNSGADASASDRRRPSVDGLLRIEESEQIDHIDDYVPPDGYVAIQALLSERRLIVLACDPGTGREAAAVNLLAETLAVAGASDAVTIHRVIDTALIGDLAWEPPIRGGGYLVVLDDALASAVGRRRALDADRIDADWLASTAARLRAADAFMVVVSGPIGGVSDHVVSELARVEPLRIVERRVLGHEPEPGRVPELHELLRSCDALALLSEQGEPRVASRIASVLRAGGDLRSRVAELRDPTAQVHQWFLDHRTPEAMSFALAAAVLEGAGYLTVSDAAVDLYAALTPEADAPPDLRFVERLGREQSWIGLTSEAPPDVPGSAFPGVPRVRFRSPLVQPVVLAYAWTRLDGQRATLIDWLRRLLTHADVEVRARAAVAAGVIAWGDPAHAVLRYLRPWAGHASWSIRQGAATALGVAGSRPELASPIWGLLREWASDESTATARRLTTTAAMTAGGMLGRQDPALATEVFREALDHEDWSVLEPVARSVAQLVEQGQARAALAALLDWSRPQDLSPLVVKALSVFVFTASRRSLGTDRVMPVPATRTGGGGNGVPVLLARSAEHREALAELWARSLARAPVQKPALEALRVLLDILPEAGHAAEAGLRDVLVEVSRRGKHRERLLYHLRAWERDRDRPSPAAARMRTALDRLSS